MSVYDWPSVVAPRGVAFNLRGMSVAGPPSMTGLSQVASVDAGYWVASFARVNVGGPAAVNAYRAFLALLEGGSHQVRVPVFDAAQIPWASAGGPSANEHAQVPFSDDATFSDDSAFYQPAIDFSLSAAAALRATTISVTKLAGGTINGGEYFSIDDQLYRIRQVLSGYGTSSQSWSISPPLRKAAPSGKQLNFDRPVCQMRLESESDGALSLDFGRFGFLDVNFVEVVPNA